VIDIFLAVKDICTTSSCANLFRLPQAREMGSLMRFGNRNVEDCVATLRSRTAAGRRNALIAAAGTLAGTLATTPAADAYAQAPLPTYVCGKLFSAGPPPGPIAGDYGCRALNGAPTHGYIFGPFRIESAEHAVYCVDFYGWSGYAEMPDAVVGDLCRPGSEQP
jgi:hypothetical protein